MSYSSIVAVYKPPVAKCLPGVVVPDAPELTFTVNPVDEIAVAERFVVAGL